MKADYCSIFKGKLVMTGHIGWNKIAADKMVIVPGYFHTHLVVDIFVFLGGLELPL